MSLNSLAIIVAVILKFEKRRNQLKAIAIQETCLLRAFIWERSSQKDLHI